MTRRLATGACVLFLFAVSPTMASAQVGVFFGAGPTFPIQDYGDYAKTGYVGSVGIWTPVGTQGLGLFGEGFYGSNSHSDVDGDKTNVYGGYGGATYRMGDPTVPGIFLIGKAGLLVHSYKSDDFPEHEGSDTQFSYGIGAGFTLPLEGAAPFATAQYIGSGDTQFIVVAVGVTIGGR